MPAFFHFFTKFTTYGSPDEYKSTKILGQTSDLDHYISRPRVSRPMPCRRQSKLNAHIPPVNSASVLFEPFVKDETIDDDQIPNL